MDSKKRQAYNLKLNNLKLFYFDLGNKWISFLGILYLFHFPGDLNWKIWSYYHGLFVNIIFLICLSFEFFESMSLKLNHNFKKCLRIIVFLILFFVLNYQWVYQTQIDFNLVGYSLNNFVMMFHELIPFIKEWNIVHFFPVLIFFILFDPFLILSNHRVDPYVLLLILYFLLVWNSWSSDTIQLNQTPSKRTNQKINRYLDTIPKGTNIILIVLEGVSRKHILEINSNYIDYSKLNGSHFWIPMPHTSKSLYTWMTGESQLYNNRIESEKKVDEVSLPRVLKNKYSYQTQMIYTQSIYFEGMNSFFPNIFDKVWDKTILESKYNGKFDFFSWGMDDRVVLTEFKQHIDGSKPFFLLIGLSQTHSPYFTIAKSDISLNKVQRHHNALEENLRMVDDLISHIRSNIKQETLFILTADHGESFGEEGAHAHNYSLYNQEVDVPFLMYLIQSDKLIIPQVGSSIHFKETLLQLMGSDLESKDNHRNFLNSQYLPFLAFKTWNSEIQRGLVKEDKKYIYHSDRNILYEMDWDERDRKIIKDSALREKIVKEIFIESSK